MPIPALLPSGILPAGIHECDLEEIERDWTYNERRREIWRGFQAVKERLLSIPEIEVIYIDGSFTSDKENPRDVDVAVEFFNAQSYFNISGRHKEILLERDRIKREYLVDLWHGFKNYTNDMADKNAIEVFQKVEERDARKRKLSFRTRKGILKVVLRDVRPGTTNE